MDPNKWTIKTQQAVQAAAELAQEAGNPEIHPVLLAVALFDDEDGVAKQVVLKVANVETYRSILRVLRRRMATLPTQEPAPESVPPSKDLLKVLSSAIKLQKKKADAYLSASQLYPPENSPTQPGASSRASFTCTPALTMVPPLSG